ncbi:MAG: ribonuclease R family protein [Acetobacter papayae]
MRHTASAPDYLPRMEDIQAVLAQDTRPLGLMDILRVLRLPVQHKASLKAQLHDMAVAGALLHLPAGRIKASVGLPEIVRVRITGVHQADGQMLIRGVVEAPCGTGGTDRTLRLSAPPVESARDILPLLPDDTVLARLRPALPGPRTGRILRMLCPAPRTGLPMTDTPPQQTELAQAALWSCDPRLSVPFHRLASDIADPASGSILLASLQNGPEAAPESTTDNAYTARPAGILGKATEPGMAGRLSLLTHAVPEAFSQDALNEAESAARTVAALHGQPAPSEREDLRSLPLITIDDESAHDFDDALWAEPTETGWRLVVAIADVSSCVPAGSALDLQARLRGTSLYLPDRVVPMLPPALSENACSLLPGQDRPCLFMDLSITRQGTLGRARLGRGLMRSAARLSYTQALLALNPQHSAIPAADISGQDTLQNPAPAVLKSLRALWDAAQALQAEALRRGVEPQHDESWLVSHDTQGNAVSFTPRTTLPTHDMVAACMVAANTQAAALLHHHGLAGLFRTHAASTSGQPRPTARYSATTAPHAGLRLACYTHFTSPIRRYADLVTHRALADFLARAPLSTFTPTQAASLTHTQPSSSSDTALEALAAHLSMTERRATDVAQACLNRLAAQVLAPLIGQPVEFHALTSTRHGLRVRLTKTGTPSFLPWSAFPSGTGACDTLLHDGVAPRRSDSNEHQTGNRNRVERVFSAVLIATCPSRGTVTLASPVHAC